MLQYLLSFLISIHPFISSPVSIICCHFHKSLINLVFYGSAKSPNVCVHILKGNYMIQDSNIRTEMAGEHLAKCAVQSLIGVEEREVNLPPDGHTLHLHLHTDVPAICFYLRLNLSYIWSAASLPMFHAFYSYPRHNEFRVAIAYLLRQYGLSRLESLPSFPPSSASSNTNAFSDLLFFRQWPISTLRSKPFIQQVLGRARPSSSSIVSL